MDLAVDASKLTRRFGKLTAVDGIDLAVPKGSSFGLLGLNGAGKTTTVRMLTTILPPSAGHARVLGRDIRTEPKALRSRIGAVFEEDPNRSSPLSPAAYLRYAGRAHGLGRERLRDRMAELFALLELGAYADRPIRTLSGGNRRKVEIARALLHGPDLLFLDEPTREMDIPTKRRLWDTLKELTDDGLTVFLSSHDAEEIGTLCDRVAILREGRIVWDGTPASLTQGGRLIDALSDLLEGKATPPAAETRGPATFQRIRRTS